MSIEQNSYLPDGDMAAIERDFNIGEYGREIGLKGFDFTGFNHYLAAGGATLVELELSAQQAGDLV